ncbi:hypothetical protein ONZ43_g187 [Nemania bipapillata]|uniref:Uncharacterized protein n=1 Tax=Nemania bipapillata TaxID=110536 RepID=A0ACC2J912_9PEZI|nr:hypothetical protein ONZ43_g187 [Nemania bipapillata]
MIFEQLLEAARKLDDANLLPDIPELLSQGQLAAERGPFAAKSSCVVLTTPVTAVPDGLSIDHIRSLAADINTQDGPDTTAVLSAVYAALRSSKLGTKPDRVALEDVALQIGQVMEPICSGATFDEDSTDYASLSRNGLLGLHILASLSTLAPRGDLVLPTKTLLSVIAFTYSSDPWTTSSSSELAQSLLSGHIANISPTQAVEPAPFVAPRLLRGSGAERHPGENTPSTGQGRFIAEDVLTGFLRPLFAKARPTTVTVSGRPAAFPEPPPRYAQGDGFGGREDDITALKPWKYARRYAVTVFQWAMENSDTDLLQQQWHLYTPILLTLLDEPQPASLKLRSISIFRNFWRLCPEGLLSRTGLADVFEQAVFPTVLSLPSLTPEADSLTLLSAAYPALFDMVGFEESDPSLSENEVGYIRSEGTNDMAVNDKHKLQTRGFTEAQRKLLDKIVREGVMVGYHHAKDHIRLVDFFCQTLRRLVDGMGILSVKYLKDIISMISEILVNPFGTKYPPALLSAIFLLQSVLQTCWPRVPHYCNEIIKITMVAWLNIEDDDDFSSSKSTKTELKQQLIKAVDMLSAVTEAAKLDMSDRVRPLLAKEPQLRPLFTCCEAK